MTFSKVTLAGGDILSDFPQDLPYQVPSYWSRHTGDLPVRMGRDSSFARHLRIAVQVLS